MKRYTRKNIKSYIGGSPSNPMVTAVLENAEGFDTVRAYEVPGDQVLGKIKVELPSRKGTSNPGMEVVLSEDSAALWGRGQFPDLISVYYYGTAPDDMTPPPMHLVWVGSKHVKQIAATAVSSASARPSTSLSKVAKSCWRPKKQPLPKKTVMFPSCTPIARAQGNAKQVHSKARNVDIFTRIC